MSFTDKRVKLNEALDDIKTGATIAIGGFSLNNSPMALIRELIRQNITDLTIIGPLPLGLQIDLLVGAGLVKKVICPAVSINGLPAPCFIRACNEGTVEVVPCDTGYTAYGLRAAAEHLPFHPYPLNVLDSGGSDLPSINTDYQTVYDPFHKVDVIIVPPLKPDVALLHIQAADVTGNCIHSGSKAADELLAESTWGGQTIITVDEIVPNQWLRQYPGSTSIPKHFIHKIVDIHFPAHPCASHSKYRVDEKHFHYYLQKAQTKEGFQEYLDHMVLKPKSHFGYLREAGGKEYLDGLKL